MRRTSRSTSRAPRANCPAIPERIPQLQATVSRIARSIFAVSMALGSAVAAGQAHDAPDDAFAGIEPVVHLRSYYWDSRSTKGDASEAWALGGWAGLKTRWLGDTLQLGVIGYTSQKLYGPADKGGSQLLGPGQDPINVLGQAFGSLRYAGQTFTGYRQRVDQPWVNPQDSRMIPNLFEGYLLSGGLAGLDYIGGYVTKIKPRDANAFEWMSSAAGSAGPQQGLILAGARFPIAEQAQLRVAEQYLVDTYNTAYADGGFGIPVGAAGTLRLEGQYANQRSVGDAGLGPFNTWMVGLRAVYERAPYSVQLAWTETSRNRETLAPFGDNPSFLNLMQIAFNDAGERAWLVGASLDFSTLGAPGLRAAVAYGSGRGAVNSATGAPLGNSNETDVRLRYEADKATRLRGLSFGIEGSWQNQAGAAAQGRQLRIFANYDIPFQPN
jgi:hypothetical protein